MPIDPDVPWPAPDPSARPRRGGWVPPEAARSRAELESPATQLVRDRDDYLGGSEGDVGVRIADDRVELFTGPDAAGALVGEFERLAPDFIALHDIGAPAALRLLEALAGAAGGRVQALHVRRQGQGVPIATIPFVEVPRSDGLPTRVYATELDADSLTRQQLALALLAHSRLAVLLVSDLPTHVLAAQLLPLREAIGGMGWPNRLLLMLPLGASTALASHAARMALGGRTEVRVTPRAESAGQAWAFVSGAWNHLPARDEGGRFAPARDEGARSAPPAPRPPGAAPAGGAVSIPTDLRHAVVPPQVPDSEAPTQRLPLPGPASAPRPAPAFAAPALVASVAAPAVVPPRPMPSPGGARWDDYVRRCAEVKGVHAACVFDEHTQRPLAHAGGRPSAERLAAQGVLLLNAMVEAGRRLGIPAARPDAVISLGSQALLLRPIPGHPGLVLHAVLDGGPALAVARVHLQRLEPR
jgi:hypothetical protein